MGDKPHGRKRPYSAFIKDNLPDSHLSPTPPSKHHPVAPILMQTQQRPRLGSPFESQLSVAYARRVLPSGPIPSGTNLTAATVPDVKEPETRPALPYSYGSEVSLDPASLSAVPDEAAIAEIKRLVPEVPMRDQCRDIWAMLETLQSDGKFATSLHHQESATKKTQAPGAWPGDSLAFTAGKDFDAMLNTLGNTGPMVPSQNTYHSTRTGNTSIC